MQKQLSWYAKTMLLSACCVSLTIRADFSFDDAINEMSHAMEKIQKKFTKINSSMQTGVNNFVQNTFSDKPGKLSIIKNDTAVILKVPVREIDKDSIKAVVHNNVLTINARNKQTEMALTVDPQSVKFTLQEKIEIESQEPDKNGEKKSFHSSMSSQQSMQTLPAEVSLQDVAVEYENGILTVKLSRVEPVVSPKVIQVIKK